MQSWNLIDIRVAYIGIRDVVIRDLAAETRTARDFGIGTLVDIQDVGHVRARRMGIRAVEGNDQRNGHAHFTEILSHVHHGVGTEGMTDKHDGSAVAGLVVGSNLARRRLPLGITADGGGNADPAEFGGKTVHAVGKHVQEAAHQIDLRCGPRGRLANCTEATAHAYEGGERRYEKTSSQHHEKILAKTKAERRARRMSDRSNRTG